MTLDEAIEHAKEVAETCNDSGCAADHIQLAEWLRQARGAGKAARWYTGRIQELEAENDKMREQIEHLQPTDCEGNVLDIADMVHMLRSEYDGDHEWDDVVVELVLTKWGGDRWIVRGSWGDAWACDCTKAGYDEDAYENFYDAEPFENPTLVEVENAKLRELAARAWRLFTENGAVHPSDLPKVDAVRDGLRELGVDA